MLKSFIKLKTKEKPTRKEEGRGRRYIPEVEFGRLGLATSWYIMDGVSQNPDDDKSK